MTQMGQSMVLWTSWISFNPPFSPVIHFWHTVIPNMFMHLKFLKKNATVSTVITVQHSQHKH